MVSQRYRILQSRVDELRTHLLPTHFDPTGIYTEVDMVAIRTLSFRVLAHAELEAYFEDRVVEIAKATWNAWEQRQAISRTTLCLLGFSGREMGPPPETLAPPTANQQKNWPDQIDIKHRLSDAISEYVRVALHENHGIREKNVLRLLLPIGVQQHQIDAVILADMDNFGRQRGEAAHQSFGGTVKQGVDPKAEYERVRLIVSGLASLDAALNSLLAV
jgi:hypothetical protein